MSNFILSEFRPKSKINKILVYHFCKNNFQVFFTLWQWSVKVDNNKIYELLLPYFHVKILYKNTPENLQEQQLRSVA